MPRSLANAYIVRELHVTAERPQNHIAIAARPVTTLPARAPTALSTIAITPGTSSPSPSRAVRTDGPPLIASAHAVNSTYPTTAHAATATALHPGTRRL